MKGNLLRSVLVGSIMLVLAACVPAQTAGVNPSPSIQPSPAPVIEDAAAAGRVLLVQSALAAQHVSLHVVDLATTEDAAGYTPLRLGQNTTYATTPVLQAGRLAAVESQRELCHGYAGGESCHPSANVLHLLDVQAWQDLTATLPTDGWVGPLHFSPDGTRLALVQTNDQTSTLLLYDSAAAGLLAQRPLAITPEVLVYNRAGTQLAVYGTPPAAAPGVSQPDAPQVVLLDAGSLTVLWTQVLSGVLSGFWCLENCDASHETRHSVEWTPAVVASPAGNRLYIVQADTDKLTTVDLEARTVRSTAIARPQTWLERLLALTAGVAEAKGGTEGAVRSAVLSPDGGQLYLVSRVMTATQDSGGIWQTNETYPGLQVIDTADGHVLATQPSEAMNITITPDGTYLLLETWNELGHGTDVLDAGTLQRVAQRLAWNITVTHRLDGQPIVLAAQPSDRRTQLGLLDPTSFGVMQTWLREGYDEWVGE